MKEQIKSTSNEALRLQQLQKTFDQIKDTLDTKGGPKDDIINSSMNRLAVNPYRSYSLMGVAYWKEMAESMAATYRHIRQIKKNMPPAAFTVQAKSQNIVPAVAGLDLSVVTQELFSDSEESSEDVVSVQPSTNALPALLHQRALPTLNSGGLAKTRAELTALPAASQLAGQRAVPLYNATVIRSTSEMQPNKTVYMIWTVKNTGQLQWPNDTELKCILGESRNASWPFAYAKKDEKVTIYMNIGYVNPGNEPNFRLHSPSVGFFGATFLGDNPSESTFASPSLSVVTVALPPTAAVKRPLAEPELPAKKLALAEQPANDRANTDIIAVITGIVTRNTAYGITSAKIADELNTLFYEGRQTVTEAYVNNAYEEGYPEIFRKVYPAQPGKKYPGMGAIVDEISLRQVFFKDAYKKYHLKPDVGLSIPVGHSSSKEPLLPMVTPQFNASIVNTTYTKNENTVHMNWTVRNTGAVRWPNNTTLQHMSGDDLDNLIVDNNFDKAEKNENVNISMHFDYVNRFVLDPIFKLQGQHDDGNVFTFGDEFKCTRTEAAVTPRPNLAPVVSPPAASIPSAAVARSEIIKLPAAAPSNVRQDYDAKVLSMRSDVDGNIVHVTWTVENTGRFAWPDDTELLYYLGFKRAIANCKITKNSNNNATISADFTRENGDVNETTFVLCLPTRDVDDGFFGEPLIYKPDEGKPAAAAVMPAGGGSAPGNVALPPAAAGGGILKEVELAWDTSEEKSRITGHEFDNTGKMVRKLETTICYTSTQESNRALKFVSGVATVVFTIKRDVSVTDANSWLYVGLCAKGSLPLCVNQNIVTNKATKIDSCAKGPYYLFGTEKKRFRSMRNRESGKYETYVDAPVDKEQFSGPNIVIMRYDKNAKTISMQILIARGRILDQRNFILFNDVNLLEEPYAVCYLHGKSYDVSIGDNGVAATRLLSEAITASLVEAGIRPTAGGAAASTSEAAQPDSPEQHSHDEEGFHGASPHHESPKASGASIDRVDGPLFDNPGLQFNQGDDNMPLMWDSTKQSEHGHTYEKNNTIVNKKPGGVYATTQQSTRSLKFNDTNEAIVSFTVTKPPGAKHKGKIYVGLCHEGACDPVIQEARGEINPAEFPVKAGKPFYLYEAWHNNAHNVFCFNGEQRQGGTVTFMHPLKIDTYTIVMRYNKSTKKISLQTGNEQSARNVTVLVNDVAEMAQPYAVCYFQTYCDQSVKIEERVPPIFIAAARPAAVAAPPAAMIVFEPDERLADATKDRGYIAAYIENPHLNAFLLPIDPALELLIPQEYDSLSDLLERSDIPLLFRDRNNENEEIRINSKIRNKLRYQYIFERLIAVQRYHRSQWCDKNSGKTSNIEKEHRNAYLFVLECLQQELIKMCDAQISGQVQIWEWYQTARKLIIKDDSGSHPLYIECECTKFAHTWQHQCLNEVEREYHISIYEFLPDVAVRRGGLGTKKAPKGFRANFVDAVNPTHLLVPGRSLSKAKELIASIRKKKSAMSSFAIAKFEYAEVMVKKLQRDHGAQHAAGRNPSRIVSEEYVLAMRRVMQVLDADKGRYALLCDGGGMHTCSCIEANRIEFDPERTARHEEISEEQRAPHNEAVMKRKAERNKHKVFNQRGNDRDAEKRAKLARNLAAEVEADADMHFCTHKFDDGEMCTERALNFCKDDKEYFCDAHIDPCINLLHDVE